MNTSTLETDRLVLRPFMVEDAKDVFECWESDPDVAKDNPASGNVMKKLGFQYEKDIPYECNEGKVRREGIQCRFYSNH